MSLTLQDHKSLKIEMNEKIRSEVQSVSEPDHKVRNDQTAKRELAQQVDPPEASSHRDSLQKVLIVQIVQKVLKLKMLMENQN